MSRVLDGKGAPFAELYEPENRRIWVSLTDVPKVVQRAFVAAEDRRFYEHKGIDERGVIRALVANLAASDRFQGGSTITQQVVKNLLVGNATTYERKIREVIAANRVEKALTKDKILELYLNSIYFGRSSWGIEVAAQSYFGKAARELTVIEGALLAGLVKGPNYYSPDRHPDRARARLAYVLDRMHADGILKENETQDVQLPAMASRPSGRLDSGFHFVDHLSQEGRAVAGIGSFTSWSYTVRSTVEPDIQRAAETSLQEGLAQYELSRGRIEWQGPETNLTESIKRIVASSTGSLGMPAWQEALQHAGLPLYDVHWPVAVVIDKNSKRGGEIKVGLRDGRILTLVVPRPGIRRFLQIYDVVFVSIAAGRNNDVRAELRVRPKVQGAAIVLENKTGKILAMVGSFSYPLSQLDRVTQARRQPGSSLKPLTYLAALAVGLQPTTLISNSPIELPPPGGSNRYTRGTDYWAPKNYDRGSSGPVTLRYALENSKNLVTAHLLDGSIAARPEDSLTKVCAIAVEAKIYSECVHFYPFVLGAQPVRPIDLAGFYAAVANEGRRPQPYSIELIERNGKTMYQHEATPWIFMQSADRAAFAQLKSMLQGVLSRGTARRIGYLAPYVGGKTGTSDGENDAWFVGFSNEVTVAVWVGYDNAGGKRRTLGSGSTGASVASPIFAQIMEATWTSYAPRTALAPPSNEALQYLETRRAGDGRGSYAEYFRADKAGRIIEPKLAGRVSYDAREARRLQRARALAAEEWNHRVFNQGQGSWTNGWGQPQWNDYQPRSRSVFFEWR